MKIEKKITSQKHYGDIRSIDDIVFIVLQTIDNSPVTHYHVVDGTAIQLVPDNYISDSVNGPRYSKFGYLHGICTKYNCISIGVPEKMSQEDKQTCLNLIMTLKQRYKIHEDNVIRQMDVTGEVDPVEWHNNDKWKKDIKDKLIDWSYTRTTDSE